MAKLNRLDDVKFVQTQGQALNEALSMANMPGAAHKSVEAAHYGSSSTKKKKKKKRKSK